MAQIYYFNFKYPKEDHPSEFDRLTPAQQSILLEWINENLKPYEIASYPIDGLSSYSLKHQFAKSERGFYINNGSFKGAMQKAGFEPYNDQARNWVFNLSKKLIKKYYGVSQTK